MQRNILFARLFKKYRLRSEFDTLKELADILAEEGLIYEESLFSHWQKGNKVPKNRKLFLTLLKIFIKRDGIVSLDQANEFLESAGLGYLTNNEIYSLPKKFKSLAPFLAPKDISNFVGREKYLNILVEQLCDYKVVLLHGPAGVGKTTLAVKLAYILKEVFPDGVLWYRLGTSSISSILTSIAYSFGEDVSKIDDDNTKASVIRSISINKRFLIIYDNIGRDADVSLLVPNAPLGSVLMTSTESFNNSVIQSDVLLSYFTKKESLTLYSNILGKEYVDKNRRKLEELILLLQNSPLAVNITAKQLKLNLYSVDSLIDIIRNKSIELSQFTYENKTLSTVLNYNFNNLKREEKSVLKSLTLFPTPDFSTEAISSVNTLSVAKTKLILANLYSLSLVEQARGGRWQIHPLVRFFLKTKVININLYQKAGRYYVRYLKEILKQKAGYQTISLNEAENVIYIFEKCIEQHFYETAIAIWRYLSSYLWDTGSWISFHKFAKKIYQIAAEIGDNKTRVVCCAKDLSMFHYWKGDMDTAERYSLEGLQLAKKLNDPYLIAFAKERLAKIYLKKSYIEPAIRLLQQSLRYFIRVKDYEQAANSLLSLGNAKVLKKQYSAAKNYYINSISYYKQMKFISLRNIYMGIIHCYLGGIDLKLRSYQNARDSFKTAIKYFNEAGERSGFIIWASLALGLYYEYNGNIHLAHANYISAKKELLYLGKNSILDSNVVLFLLLNDELKKSEIYTKLFR